MEMINKQTAQHYVWGNGCDGWHLVCAGSLSIIEERMPPGTAEVRHYHRQANQFFYVLRGILTFELEEENFRLSAGDGVEIAPGREHKIRNTSNSGVEFLVISSPPSHGDRVVVDPDK